MTNEDKPKLVRKYIFDYFLENCRAPVLEEVMWKFRLNRDEAFTILRGLQASHHILLLSGTQRILMANPFSGITTPFRDTIAGKTYFVNCAWDTVSLHVMLGQDTDIEAFCHHCAEPIRLRLSRGRMVRSEPANPLIFLSVPVAKWYDDLVNTCSNNMVFFSSEEHKNLWLQLHPGLNGETLTVEKMAEACQPLSMDRMKLDYAKPSPDRLVAYWDSIGLRGENWKI